MMVRETALLDLHASVCRTDVQWLLLRYLWEAVYDTTRGTSRGDFPYNAKHRRRSHWELAVTRNRDQLKSSNRPFGRGEKLIAGMLGTLQR